MLARFLGPRAEIAYALLRIVAGLMFSVHGMQKLFGLFTANAPVAFGTQRWLGGIIEFTTGFAIAAGAWTTWAAFLASGTMAVAYIQFHWKFQLGGQLIPIVNKGELALLYSFLFLYIACRGAGLWSVDAKRARVAGASTGG